MRVLVITIASLSALWAVTWLLTSDVYGRRQRMSDFPNAIRTVLLLMGDGGRLHAQQVGSPFRLDFVRSEGDQDGAMISIEVPRAEWSAGREEEICRVLEKNGFGQELSSRSSANFHIGLSLRIQNIWDEGCTARPARAAQLIASAFGADPNTARFRFRLVGPRARRISKRVFGEARGA